MSIIVASAVNKRKLQLFNPSYEVHGTLVDDLDISVRLCLEVAFVKVMDAHETVFSSRCVSGPSWVPSDAEDRMSLTVTRYGRIEHDSRIKWAEMTFYAAHLFSEDLVPEACLELALSERSCGNLPCLLSPA